MINKIQTSFAIDHLEMLTGIKAHTIRIWEKRYGLLTPDRLNRNIRLYTLEDLQKILNISLLYNHGHKISKIASYTDSQLAAEVKQIALMDLSGNYHVNTLLISMYTFDERLFEQVYTQQIEKISFEKIFLETYLPLLQHIGILWQTDAIKPAHEHFISNLINLKIALNIASIKTEAISDEVYVLFLPEGEIHEIGLYFLQYYLKLNCKRTIYLGRDIPIDNLQMIKTQFKKVTWITYALIDKPIQEKAEFLSQIRSLLHGSRNKCLIFGSIWADQSSQNTDNQLVFYDRMKYFLSEE